MRRRAEPGGTLAKRSGAEEHHAVHIRTWHQLSLQEVPLEYEESCCRKWDHTLLFNSPQFRNEYQEYEVALNSAQQSPSVTSRSAALM